jgi:hypothetical protein
MRFRGDLQLARKQTLALLSILLVVAALTALVAYRLGLWHSSSSWAANAKGGCVDFHDARSRLGETSCVSGRVLRAFTSRGGNSFLGFCPDYRECPFSAVVFASDRNKFGDLDTLAGRQVEIEGPIADYHGRAEIILHGPQQIRVLP